LPVLNHNLAVLWSQPFKSTDWVGKRYAVREERSQIVLG